MHIQREAPQRKGSLGEQTKTVPAHPFGNVSLAISAEQPAQLILRTAFQDTFNNDATVLNQVHLIRIIFGEEP